MIMPYGVNGVEHNTSFTGVAVTYVWHVFFHGQISSTISPSGLSPPGYDEIRANFRVYKWYT